MRIRFVQFDVRYEDVHGDAGTIEVPCESGWVPFQVEIRRVPRGEDSGFDLRLAVWIREETR